MDLTLVLAVDSSGSVDDDEYAFQQQAIAAAFRDEQVLSAIRNAGLVAIAAVFGGDGEFPSQSIGWTAMRDRIDADGFARMVEGTQRGVFGNTDIGSGIWTALDLLADPHLCAFRSTIDVSGDGRETIAPKRKQVPSLLAARRRAEGRGVTVNALVISDDGEDLAGYYAGEVITGAGAFVMDIHTYGDYADAIRRKLVREISPRQLSRLALRE